MTQTHRIVFIHATRVAIEPIESATRTLWPEAEPISILDESLALDRASGAATLGDLNRRIVALCRYAETLQSAGILYTCSSFGEGIEEAARTSPLPVLKPNQAMFEAALSAGDDIAMLYTFEPAAEGMEREFHEEAARAGSGARLRSVFVDGALAALRGGDAARHDALISDAAAAVESAHAILLAQFSMASAAGVARSRACVPVLTSPEAAIEKLQGCVRRASAKRGQPC